jgi:hypothetical protein
MGSLFSKRLDPDSAKYLDPDLDENTWIRIQRIRIRNTASYEEQQCYLANLTEGVDLFKQILS